MFHKNITVHLLNNVIHHLNVIHNHNYQTAKNHYVNRQTQFTYTSFKPEITK